MKLLTLGYFLVLVTSCSKKQEDKVSGQPVTSKALAATRFYCPEDKLVYETEAELLENCGPTIVEVPIDGLQVASYFLPSNGGSGTGSLEPAESKIELEKKVVETSVDEDSGEPLEFVKSERLNVKCESISVGVCKFSYLFNSKTSYRIIGVSLLTKEKVISPWLNIFDLKFIATGIKSYEVKFKSRDIYTPVEISYTCEAWGDEVKIVGIKSKSKRECLANVNLSFENICKNIDRNLGQHPHKTFQIFGKNEKESDWSYSSEVEECPTTCPQGEVCTGTPPSLPTLEVGVLQETINQTFAPNYIDAKVRLYVKSTIYLMTSAGATSYDGVASYVDVGCEAISLGRCLFRYDFDPTKEYKIIATNVLTNKTKEGDWFKYPSILRDASGNVKLFLSFPIENPVEVTEKKYYCEAKGDGVQIVAGNFENLDACVQNANFKHEAICKNINRNLAQHPSKSYKIYGKDGSNAGYTSYEKKCE